MRRYFPMSVAYVVNAFGGDQALRTTRKRNTKNELIGVQLFFEYSYCGVQT